MDADRLRSRRAAKGAVRREGANQPSKGCHCTNMQEVPEDMALWQTWHTRSRKSAERSGYADGERWTPNKPNMQRPAVASIHLLAMFNISEKIVCVNDNGQDAIGDCVKAGAIYVVSGQDPIFPNGIYLTGMDAGHPRSFNGHRFRRLEDVKKHKLKSCLANNQAMP